MGAFKRFKNVFYLLVGVHWKPGGDLNWSPELISEKRLWTPSVGWSEIKLLLKSQNFQADYGSMIIPEQLQKFLVIGCIIFCENGLKESAFLHCKNGVKMTKSQKC